MKCGNSFDWLARCILNATNIIYIRIQSAPSQFLSFCFQLVMFGNERYSFAKFLTQNTVSFRHLMLQV